MSVDYDVVVVGAGPGGSTAARFCAKAGLKTLLIEKENMPRYKACGGCLSLKTIDFLDLDLSPVLENTIYGVRFSHRMKDPFSIASKEPVAFMVMRDRFDHFLVSKALEEGSGFLEGVKVIRAEEKRDGMEVVLSQGEKIHAEYLIGADGSESMVAKSLSLVSSKGSGVGVESEIPYESTRGFPKEELQRIHLNFGGVPNGYGWVFPKEEGLSIGIGGMFTDGARMNPRKYFAEFLKGLNYIREEKVKKVVGHSLPCFYDEEQKVAKGRVLLVGDAARLMDPLLGEGIYYALRSGRLAAEAILYSKENGSLPSSRYQSAIHDQISENLKWALRFSRFVFRFTPLAYRTLEHYPELADVYLQVLEGKETYQGFVVRVKERMRNLLQGRLSEKIRKAMARV